MNAQYIEKDNIKMNIEAMDDISGALRDYEDTQMSPDEKIETYGLLAELSYLKLEDYNASLADPKALETFLKSEGSEIPPERHEMMMETLQDYEIVDFRSDDGTLGTDFQGMLFQNKSTGEYVIGFRGTEETAGDIMTDIAMDARLGNHNPQFEQAQEFVQDMQKKYNISDSELTLTGHSLGGILVQQVSAKEKIKGYTYNSLGASELTKYEYPALHPLGLLERGADALGFNLNKDEIDFAKNNIVNISYEHDPLSNEVTKVNGSEFISGKTTIAGEDLGNDSHSIAGLNDKIVKDNETLIHFKDENLETLNEAYMLVGRDELENTFNKLDVNSAPPGSLTLETLSDKEIADYDLEDPATLYAIEHLNPVAIVGDLDAYKDISINNYSKEQITEKAQFYYNQMHNVSETEGELHNTGDSIVDLSSVNNKVEISEGLISTSLLENVIHESPEEEFDSTAKALEVALSVYNPANDNVNTVGIERD